MLRTDQGASFRTGSSEMKKFGNHFICEETRDVRDLVSPRRMRRGERCFSHGIHTVDCICNRQTVPPKFYCAVVLECLGERSAVSVCLVKARTHVYVREIGPATSRDVLAVTVFPGDLLAARKEPLGSVQDLSERPNWSVAHNIGHCAPLIMNVVLKSTNVSIYSSLKRPWSALSFLFSMRMLYVASQKTGCALRYSSFQISMESCHYISSRWPW